MKLIPRRRRPIRSVRSGPSTERGLERDPSRHTPVTMDKRGGMARDERERSGLVLGLGSRFRVPAFDSERLDSGPGPAGRPYRISVVSKNVSQRLLGLPLLRLEVEVKQQGQAYRVLEPSTSRFRMRSRNEEQEEPDPRFHTAGRGGPKILLEEEVGKESGD
jgi:hypothetical protein